MSLIKVTEIKERAKAEGLNVGSDFIKEFELKCLDELHLTFKRAKSNTRKTVYARDC